MCVTSDRRIASFVQSGVSPVLTVNGAVHLVELLIDSADDPLCLELIEQLVSSVLFVRCVSSQEITVSAPLLQVRLLVD